MLHAGLDLVAGSWMSAFLKSDEGEVVDEFAVPPDADGLRGLARRLGPVEVRGVIESMTGARFVHDTLEQLGWDVLIAHALKVKGLAPLACKTDKIDARVLAVLSFRDLVPEIWLPDPRVRKERELARFRMHLVKHKSMLKHRVHLDADQLRQALPGHQPVRRGRTQPARRPADSRAMAVDPHREPERDRRSRPADRSGQPQAQGDRP